MSLLDDIAWAGSQFDWITPAIQLSKIVGQGHTFLTFTPPPGWSGYRTAKYLQSQGVKCGTIGTVSRDGEVTVTVDDYGKALDALARLNR